MTNTLTTTTSLRLTVPAVSAVIAQPPSAREHDPIRTQLDAEFKCIFHVLETLGKHLVALGVINHGALPEARLTTSHAIELSDKHNSINSIFGDGDEAFQSAVTSAMVFCAECSPMPMWPGFGCGVMGNPTWADIRTPLWSVQVIEAAIATLKSQPRTWNLLTKSPTRISRTEPYFEEYPEDLQKTNKAIQKDFVRQFQKRGFRFRAPYQDVQIKNWWIPHATWGGRTMYHDSNIGQNYELPCTYQEDCGRFLWAWTVGKHAELREGEAILLIDEGAIGYLAEWLEGLNGMNFKVLLDSDLDYSKVKLKSSTKKQALEWTGHKLGVIGAPYLMIAAPTDNSQYDQVSGRCMKQNFSSLGGEALPPYQRRTAEQRNGFARVWRSLSRIFGK